MAVLQPLRWCCVDCVIHHEWDVREEQKYMYVARTSNNRVISIVACCHGAKLCAHAARDFRSQQNGAVTRMWRSCGVQPSHKERAIGVVRCKKEGMLLQPLRWCCVDCVIHHERDVRKEQKYIAVYAPLWSFQGRSIMRCSHSPVHICSGFKLWPPDVDSCWRRLSWIFCTAPSDSSRARSLVIRATDLINFAYFMVVFAQLMPLDNKIDRPIAPFTRQVLRH